MMNYGVPFFFFFLAFVSCFLPHFRKFNTCASFDTKGIPTNENCIDVKFFFSQEDI